jgi:hypothetical protein
MGALNSTGHRMNRKHFIKFLPHGNNHVCGVKGRSPQRLGKPPEKRGENRGKNQAHDHGPEQHDSSFPNEIYSTLAGQQVIAFARFVLFSGQFKREYSR